MSSVTSLQGKELDAMSNLEHYFENLLYLGQDVKGDLNKNTLTEAEQAAVWTCVDYVLYSIFLNRDDFLKFVNGDTNADQIRHMNDKELAEIFIGKCGGCPEGSWDTGECKYADIDGVNKCRVCWMEWLKSNEKDN